MTPLPAAEIAKRLRVSVSSFYAHVRPKLPPSAILRIGGSVRYDYEKCIEVLRGRDPEPPRPALPPAPVVPKPIVRQKPLSPALERLLADLERR